MNKEIESFKVEITNFKKDPKRRPIRREKDTFLFLIDQTTKEKIIVKQTNDYLKNRQKEQLFYREVEILAFAKHPAILQFFGWDIARHKGQIYFRQEDIFTLYDLLMNVQNGIKNPIWDETHKLIISYGIASAMKYLHLNEIAHQFLNYSNILLDSELHPYITGFEKSPYLFSAVEEIFNDNHFVAPEFITDFEYNKRSLYSDVFSYAMILYCIWTEQEPYHNSNPIQICKCLMKRKRPNFPSTEIPPQNWRKLIENCWDQNPHQRPTFDQICQLIESSEFLNDRIDKDQFIAYKNILDKDLYGSSKIIDQLKKEADEGNADSQLAYALRLYNGFEIEKNLDESKHYFELAADNGNAESQFYLSLILEHEGNIEKSVEYFQKSIDSGCSEAYSNYAQQLINQGNIDESLPYLHYAIQRGSISAFIAYGNVCELNNDKYGCPDIFYEIASNCCHCLDSVGLYFPIDYKVFKCEDCNIEMCEGCAKSCHKGHNLVEIGVKNAFICECGKNHFIDKMNRKHCSVEFVGEMKCDDEPAIYQHFFKCLDCDKHFENLICKGCAENCHSGHKVIDCGIKKGFCYCGSNKSNHCKISYFIDVDKDKCSRDLKNIPVTQRWFQCMTCGLYGNEKQGICISCAHKCHNGHLLLDRGVQENICQCVDINQCQLNK